MIFCAPISGGQRCRSDGAAYNPGSLAPSRFVQEKTHELSSTQVVHTIGPQGSGPIKVRGWATLLTAGRLG